MPTPSTLTTGVFLLTVLMVAVRFVAGWRKVAPGGSWLGVPILVLAGWLALPALLARTGVLDRYAPPPPPAMLLVAVITAGTVALALSPVGGRLAAGLSLPGLVGFQVFRVPVEWVLHRLYVEGVIPVEMTYSGRNFDIVSGVTAVLLASWLRSGRRAPGLVLAWNLLGLGLLANIVVIAVLATPTFRAFPAGPPNLLPGTFPYIWLPTFLVQAALFGHLVVFRALRNPEPR